ncbi:MAG TPA: LamG-like jellyroll fold domain-containing protein [Verrucomicrobiae bacterium]|nr:LamG-like jellyroll fold domain-containing protein [Verrucomicrobiae bacterium]
MPPFPPTLLTPLGATSGGVILPPIAVAPPTPPIVIIPWTPLSQCTPPPSGIVAWWPGESNAWDVIGGHDGTLVNGAGFAAGYVGTAFSFATTNAGIKVPASTSLDVGTGGGLTVEGWIKPTDLSQRGEIFEWNNGDTNLLFTWGVQLVILGPDEQGLGAGNIFADVHGADGEPHQLSAPGGALTANVFQHVALTYDKGTGVATIYCNGAVVAQQSFGQFTPLTSYDFYIGLRPAGEGVHSFPGEIDESAVYNRALSAAEIAAIYNAGAAGKCESPCAPQPSGAVAWWPGESNAFDVVAGNNGTVPPQVDYTTGKVGLGFDFHGNANITIPDAPALNPTNQLTIEAWVYPRARNPYTWSQDLVTKDGECGDREYMLNVGDSTATPGAGDFRAHMGLDSGLLIFDGATIIQPNTWYHVAETYDGTHLTLYVNGVVDGQMAASGNIITTTQPMRIGGGAPDGCLAYYFDGIIDEPTLYNRALSSNEIAAIYFAGAAGKCSLPSLAPVVITPPTSQTVIEGGEADLSVTAVGAGTLSYQWLFNGVKVAGAKSAALSLPDIHPYQAGNYSVRVTSASGSVTSAPAVITVISQKILIYNYSGSEKVTTQGTETSYNFSGELFFIPDTTNATFVGWANINGTKQYWVTATSDYQWFKVNGSLGRSYTVLGKAGMTFDGNGRPSLWSFLHKGQNANLPIATGKTYLFPNTFTFSDTELYPDALTGKQVLREASSNYNFLQGNTQTANNGGQTVYDLQTALIASLVKQGYHPQ